MNIDAIKKTAILRREDEDYIVESPLCPDVLGVGDTEAEAWQIFQEVLVDYEADHKANRVAKGPGRPAKGKKKFAVEMDPDITSAIAASAKALGISQGELVEGAYRLFQRSLPELG
jgi:predicted RNase H-like HicB family nuclease